MRVLYAKDVLDDTEYYTTEAGNPKTMEGKSPETRRGEIRRENLLRLAREHLLTMKIFKTCNKGKVN